MNTEQVKVVTMAILLNEVFIPLLEVVMVFPVCITRDTRVVRASTMLWLWICWALVYGMLGIMLGK